MLLRCFIRIFNGVPSEGNIALAADRRCDLFSDSGVLPRRRLIPLVGVTKPGVRGPFPDELLDGDLSVVSVEFDFKDGSMFSRASNPRYSALKSNSALQKR